MAESHSLKPDKSAFLYFPIIKRLAFLVILMPGLYVFLGRIGMDNPQSLLYTFIFYGIAGIIWFVLLSVRYKKENYLFYPEKIVRKSGSIISDHETELVIRNITHIDMTLPFIENKLFHTGTIAIESAGSGKSEIMLRSIGKPKEFFTYVEKLMKTNGFSLKLDSLVQEEKPATIGVILETFSRFALSIFKVIAFIFYFVFTIFEDGGDFGFLTDIDVMILLLPVIIIGLIYSAFRFIIIFLDLKQRVYQVYKDGITYSEGFLTKHESMIPFENLSDTEITQTIFDRILGLYDVKVSCQGSGQEILFKNMENGPVFKKTVDGLIRTSDVKIEKAQAKRMKAAAVQKKIVRDTSFTAELRMDRGRVLKEVFVALIVMWFPPVLFYWFFYLIYSLIKVSATKYIVNSNSVEEHFKFINKKDVEFSIDKIMAVVIKRNLFDQWFGSCQIHFWSIGSSADIKFKNIKMDQELIDNILSKIGVREEDIIYDVRSQFSFGEFIKAHIYLTALFVMVCGFIVGLGVAIHPFFYGALIIPLLVLVLTVMYLSAVYKRTNMKFTPTHVAYKTGFFVKDRYYALYDNIKDITTTHYPSSTKGDLRFDVAGEHIMQQGKNKSIISNYFSMGYVPKIETKDELIDTIFFDRPDKAKIEKMEADISPYLKDPVYTSTEDLANSIAFLLFFSVIIFPLLLLLPITLPLTIVWVKRKKYVIQDYRLLVKSGIFYRKQISIIFQKIDHINLKQGILNKMFRNGSITVHTAGSSGVEMTVANISDYTQFYSKLKENY